jgi:histidinol-phosphate aminotransferase
MRDPSRHGESVMPEHRLSIQNMRPYSPPTGGRHDKLRLDFNENTVGCSPRVAAFLKEAITRDLLATYPDYKEVRADLSTFLGVRESELVLTNGTDEAIQVLVNTFVEAGDEVVVMSPSYAMYRFYAEVAGATIVEVPYEAVDLSFNLERLINSVSESTKAILLANPNNPTGTAIASTDLETLLRRAPQACVLVDEAYFEFYGQTMLGRLSEFENLFVSRTFSKAYGMAAMRMGCLMSRESNVGALRKGQSPYSVNMLGALAAREAIKDADYTANYVESALDGRRVIESSLRRKGVPFWPSEANFVLFDAGAHADKCLRKCGDAGVLIRDRRHEIPGALRVTAGTPAQVERFVEVLEEIW